MMNKDSIPLYSGYEDEEKPSNLYKIITSIVKVILFVVGIFVIGFAAAWGTFVATYYFTASNEKPASLMDESCFIQLPFHILKNLQREFNVDTIIEDDVFPKYYEVLREIEKAYDQKAERLVETFTKQVNVRAQYYKPDPTIILATVFFFSTIFSLIVRCIPFHQPFIVTERDAKVLQVKQFLRSIVYTYVVMLYAIGAYKLYYVFDVDCTSNY